MNEKAIKLKTMHNRWIKSATKLYEHCYKESFHLKWKFSFADDYDFVSHPAEIDYYVDDKLVVRIIWERRRCIVGYPFFWSDRTEYLRLVRKTNIIGKRLPYECCPLPIKLMPIFLAHFTFLRKECIDFDKLLKMCFSPRVCALNDSLLFRLNLGYKYRGWWIKIYYPIDCQPDHICCLVVGDKETSEICLHSEIKDATEMKFLAQKLISFFSYLNI